jgi:RNA polymerase sigma-70 factor (ECF subfamily)
MADLPTTRPSLLVRLRQSADQEAWREFVGLYAPLIYGFGRKHGLQDADASDLTQEVLRGVSTAIRRLDYDPQRGTFRAWLFTLVRRRLADFLAQRARQPQASGDSADRERLKALPAPEEVADWNTEFEQHLFARAIDRVKQEFTESTWQAFQQTAIEGRKPRDVAETLGLSVGAVYIAKSRVQARLKEELTQLE